MQIVSFNLQWPCHWWRGMLIKNTISIQMCPTPPSFLPAAELISGDLVHPSRARWGPLMGWQQTHLSKPTYPVRLMAIAYCHADWFEDLLNCISVLRQFVSPQNGLSLRRSFSRWPYSVPQACYLNPSTDMAPLVRCLDHTEPPTWYPPLCLNWCLPTNQIKQQGCVCTVLWILSKIF